MDITMTATLRPAVMKKTLASFYKNMLQESKQEFRLIINIDPIGEDVSSQDIVNIAKQYFSSINVQFARTANFAKAFKWVWEQTKSKHVLNIEDDWELLRPVDLDTMLKIMEDEKDLALLRLPFTNALENKAKQWDNWFPWNGRYFECPAEMRGGLGFSGHPSLIRKEFIDQIAPNLLTDRCPEKQIKHHYPMMGKILMKWKFGVYQKQNEKKAVVDIGRLWRANNGLIKEGRASFTHWKKCEI